MTIKTFGENVADDYTGITDEDLDELEDEYDPEDI